MRLGSGLEGVCFSEPSPGKKPITETLEKTFVRPESHAKGPLETFPTYFGNSTKIRSIRDQAIGVANIDTPSLEALLAEADAHSEQEEEDAESDALEASDDEHASRREKPRDAKPGADCSRRRAAEQLRRPPPIACVHVNLSALDRRAITFHTTPAHL